MESRTGFSCLVLIFAALSEVKRRQAEQAAEKGPAAFCHFERSEESLFLSAGEIEERLLTSFGMTK